MQTAGQPRAYESLSPEIDVLMGSERDLSLLSFVRFLKQGEDIQNEKIEWRDDQLPPEKLSLTASGAGADWDTNNDIAGLPVADAERAKLKIGDVLELPSGEHVIVKAIDDSGDTIDLVKRGWGGTTAAAQGAVAFTAKIIGNAQVDGSDPLAASYYAPTERYNYVQIFEDVLAVSGKVARSKVTREAERARQRGIKLKRLLSQLNFALLNGSRELLNGQATFQGLRNTATTTYNVNGSLTVAKVYAMLTAMINAGGSPGGIHGSATGIGRIEQLMAAYVTTGVSEFHAKLTVKKISVLGMDVELHVDKHMLDTEFLVIDYDRISKHNMSSDEASGEFGAYILEENAKQIKEQVAGYKTVKIKQPAASIVRAYGCTG